MGDIVNTLKNLTVIPGPSGYEYEVADYIKNQVKERCEQIIKDNLGNLICKLNTLPGAPRVLVFAHMDEIGFIIRKIEKNGFIRVERLGGIPEKSLAGTRVWIITEEDDIVEGIIGSKSHHITPQEEKYKVIPVQELYIDIGAETQEEVLNLGISVGSPVVYGRTFIRRENKIFANTLDNRGGCAVLIETLEDLKRDDLHTEVFFVFSVQEEFNLRGILPVAEEIKPEIAICIDISIASDTPDLMGYSDISLGMGPTLNLYSFHGRGTLSGLIPSKGFVKYMLQIAAKNNLKIQRNVFFGGLTDASYIQLQLKGIPSIDLGFPIRYSHAPIEVCDVNDLIELKKWLTLTLYDLDASKISAFSRR